jgi:hypothetical protein
MAFFIIQVYIIGHRAVDWALQYKVPRPIWKAHFKVEFPIWALQVGLWALYCKALNLDHHVM